MSSTPLSTENLAQQQLDLLCSASRRIVLVQALSGSQLCLPGAATSQNGWTVSAQTQVKAILGQLVCVIESDGTVSAATKMARVTDVLTAHGLRSAPAHYTLHDCGGHTVAVMTMDVNSEHGSAHTDLTDDGKECAVKATTDTRSHASAQDCVSIICRSQQTISLPQ